VEGIGNGRDYIRPPHLLAEQFPIVERRFERLSLVVLAGDIRAAIERRQCRVPLAVHDIVQQRRVAVPVAALNAGAMVQKEAKAVRGVADPEAVPAKEKR
jgi:hypothetical protein